LRHREPQELRAAGYFTAIVGKWHLGAEQIWYWPTRRGFDYFYGFAGGSKIDYWEKTMEIYPYTDSQTILNLHDGETLETEPSALSNHTHAGKMPARLPPPPPAENPRLATKSDELLHGLERFR
jgi:hypothetical protein